MNLGHLETIIQSLSRKITALNKYMNRICDFNSIFVQDRTAATLSCQSQIATPQVGGVQLFRTSLCLVIPIGHRVG